MATCRSKIIRKCPNEYCDKKTPDKLIHRRNEIHLYKRLQERPKKIGQQSLAINNHLQKPPATGMTEKTNANKLPEYMATSNNRKNMKITTKLPISKTN